MKKKLYSIINAVFDYLGFEVRRKDYTTSRHTLRGTCEQAKKLDFNPQVVIDVGAARGTFELYETFPDAKHLLIEPLGENKPFLEKIVLSLKDARYVIAAATKKSGLITLNVHPDYDGSSIYREDEDSNVNGVPRSVRAVMLDDLCREHGLQGPCLIKIDVQGAELDVLEGATETMKSAEYIILEATLFKFFNGGPQLFDVMNFMKQRGFVVYDILDYGYRPLDGAMSQVDLVFVKENGIFRKYHFYATKEQRASQNASLVNELYNRGMKRE